jgi:hypothetical protein
MKQQYQQFFEHGAKGYAQINLFCSTKCTEYNRVKEAMISFLNLF